MNDAGMIGTFIVGAIAAVGVGLATAAVFLRATEAQWPLPAERTTEVSDPARDP